MTSDLNRLTAIALQTLENADVPEWRTLGFFVPMTLRNRIGLWLAKQHNPITGEFMERAPVYDRKMIVSPTDPTFNW